MSKWLHARRSRKRWIFENPCWESFLGFKKRILQAAMRWLFLAIKTRGNVFKRFLLSQTQAKTTRRSIGTIFMTIRRLKVATSSENEEKLDFRKKPIQTELIKHFYTGHEVRFLASKTGGNAFKNISFVLNVCKNIWEIDWYDLHDHTACQNGYMVGNRRKSNFFQ